MYILPIVFTIVVTFLIDMNIRFGLAIWIGYAFSVFYSVWKGSKKTAYITAAVCTALIFIKILFVHSENVNQLFLVNRIVSGVYIWGLTFFLMYAKNLFRNSARAEAEELFLLKINNEWKITYVNIRHKHIESGINRIINKNFWDSFPELVNTEYETKYREAMEEKITKEFTYYSKKTGFSYLITVYPSETGIDILSRFI